MARPITYADKPRLDELMQGDILERTPALLSVIEEVHPYFRQPKYLYFMVVTQSCDLVPRHDGACKATYITLAPVRSLDTVVERELMQYRLPINSRIPVLTDKSRSQLGMFLARLLNNNEPGYFYLAPDSEVLTDDCCAFLNLAFAIKTEKHFDACVKAKKLELRTEWQAKLGWLIAQMYSRVGTDDLDPKSLNAKVSALLKDASQSVPDAKSKGLVEEAAKITSASGTLLSPVEVTKIVGRLATKKDEVIKRTVEVLCEALPYGTAEDIPVVLDRRLKSDTQLAALLKS